MKWALGAMGMAVCLAWGALAMAAYPYREQVREAARRHGIEEALIRAVMRAESSFDQYAISPDGALGLMQLMITTAREYEPGVSRFQLREEAGLNIDIGARHLKKLNRALGRRYPQVKGLERVRLVAAAYNAGWGRLVAAGGGVPPFRETQVYSRRVVRYYREYGGRLQPPLISAADSKPVPALATTSPPLPVVAEQGAQVVAAEKHKVAGGLAVLFFLQAGLGWVHFRRLRNDWPGPATRPALPASS
ncbi:MAG: transglycosylase SLT domain-containing protein [Candidatus Latescibacteria bacterium]|nr:transglycosylase SLT domain-containing protein [Candidatus Latescibacterota bacterium]